MPTDRRDTDEKDPSSYIKGGRAAKVI